MRPRTVILLVIGLSIGGLAVKMGVDIVKRAQASQGTSRPVVVTAANIDATAALTEGMLSVKRVPEALVPSGAITDLRKIIGRVAATSIPSGVVLSTSMLAPPGTEPGLRSRIPDGYRAVAVKVDEASGVAGFLVPGSRVDVSAMMTRLVNGRSKSYTELILTDVEVGAVGQSLSAGGGDSKGGKLFRSVTLLLPPADVPKLQLAMSKGQIHLALRNGRDGGLERSVAAAERFRELLSAFRTRSEPRPKPRAKLEPLSAVGATQTVEVYRGATVERLVFREIGGKWQAAGAGLSGGALPSGLFTPVKDGAESGTKGGSEPDQADSGDKEVGE
ncbi:MAG: Flp pilus assembly protein CpaB [Phycisphaerae bacterium]|nr:Flp pilus assembly protein CpaB [Phycisphaerae bacterium]